VSTSAGAFRHLAQALQLRPRTLRNRVNFGTHTATMSEGGVPGDRHLGHHLERARGGAVRIVVEPVPVHARAPTRPSRRDARHDHATHRMQGQRHQHNPQQRVTADLADHRNNCRYAFSPRYAIRTERAHRRSADTMVRASVR
jgi:2,4-dienoyl-CoA reductase-like NADH-dependent reductase (Old Yellow Enzyme family)